MSNTIDGIGYIIKWFRSKFFNNVKLNLGYEMILRDYINSHILKSFGKIFDIDFTEKLHCASVGIVSTDFRAYSNNDLSPIYPALGIWLHTQLISILLKYSRNSNTEVIAHQITIKESDIRDGVLYKKVCDVLTELNFEHEFEIITDPILERYLNCNDQQLPISSQLDLRVQGNIFLIQQNSINLIIEDTFPVWDRSHWMLPFKMGVGAIDLKIGMIKVELDYN